MTVLNDQESSWINEVAKRLRLVQAEASALPSDQRREFIQEEVNRNLADVPPANRKRYLEALLARFPVNGGGSQTAPAAASAPSTDLSGTLEELIEAVIAKAAALPEDRRAAVAKRLAEAGFSWVDRDALVLEVTDEFRQALALPPEQQPRLTRVVQLTVVLVDLFYRLDATAVKTLSEIAPRSTLLTRPRDFREAVAAYLTGTTESVEPQVRAMSALLGGFMAALLGAGREYGRQYVERFSPTAIEDVIKGEGKVKWWVPGSPTEKELCWDKFKDLAKDFATADLIDRRIKDCLATFVEKKVLAGR